MSLIGEIRGQPDAAARFLDRRLDTARAIADAVRRGAPSYAFIAARGSSDHAAIYAQYVFGLRNRLPVALAAPSMFSLYRQPPRLHGAAVIGISQSGESPDIVAVLAEGRRQGTPTIAITNVERSPIARAAEHVLLLEAGPEIAVAATKTYTAQLLAIAALSVGLAEGSDAERRSAEAALRAVPAAIALALESDGRAQALAERHRGLTRAIVLGRGYEYATARELALKIQELTAVMAHSWSGADFEHGPLALLERGDPVIAIVSNDVAGDALVPLLRRLRDDHDASVMTISDRAELTDFEPLRAHRPAMAGTPGRTAPARPPQPALPSWLAPIASIVPGQLLAYHLARARGLDPDRPRSIAKVTRTR